ncbi:MAG: tetratricopeptide repeat protein [Syntrophales bacterium]
MSTPEVKRKLATILSGDVKGYGRLLTKDEAGTIRTLNTYKEVMTSLIQQHGGKVIDAPGDHVLAEFPSVADAVQCAVDIQKELKNRNDELPEPRRMEYRFGINLGEVSEKEEKIFGDGLNVATRIQNLADAGGICLSGIVYEQIKDKLELRYEYIGKQTVKNIAKPVRIYRVLPEGETASLVSSWKRIGLNYWNRVHPAIKILVALIAAANAVWQMYPMLSRHPAQVASKEQITAPLPEKPSTAVTPSTEEKITSPVPEKVTKPAPSPTTKMEVASKEKMAFPLPDDPSIAVLPFVNMSEDPKQEFLSDGITEEIITALSKVRHLFVISRQSTFSYKGKPVKVKQVSEELGVRYVLEGSVQRSADRIRINAQLIDALTGRHIWAERYDRDLTDIFALQDEITIKTLTAIRVKLTEGEQASTFGKYYKGKQGLDCYLKIMEGWNYYWGHNIGDARRARRIAEEAIAMCPDVPMTYVLMGLVNQIEYWLGLGKSPRESIEKGIELTQKALAMDDSVALAHALLSHFYSLKREYGKSIAEGERAVALDPGGADAHMAYAMSLNYAGRAEEAIPIFVKAIRLNPLGETGNFLHLGQAYRAKGLYKEAASEYKKALHLSPDNLFAHLGLTATYILMGREGEARAEAAEVLRINPKFSLDSFAKILPFKDQSVIDNYINALRKAGLK